MTTIENPTTEKMNGSSRMTTSTDSPWWIVRPSLAAGLAGSFALTAGVFRFAGMPGTGTGTAITARSLADLMQVLSGTPTLIALGVFACAILFRRNTHRSLRILCALLALASFTGAGINAARDSHGRGPIEVWVDQALPEMPALLAGK